MLKRLYLIVLSICVVSTTSLVQAQIDPKQIYDPGKLEPTASELRVKVGAMAPDFVLPSIDGENVTLSDYQQKTNVVLSFVPAAWTPICSGQWPEYNAARDDFEKYDTIIIGISTDNTPTLFAWTTFMNGFWFPVLSDFWPHGFVAERYGVLRNDGMAERAIFVIDKEGIIRHIEVYDINAMPPLEDLVKVLETLQN